jgi:precorrin-2/cobalt-factor-2 C20-methyltransferase
MKLLYGIGVGPGDPDLLTVKAIRIVREADYVFVPRPKIEERGMAETIVAEYLDESKAIYLHFPMGPNNAKLYKQTASRIAATLHDGECGAFITIGDPMVYSTFTYVMFEAQKLGVSVDIVPGISSCHASAAALQWPLTIKGESSYLADGHVDEDVLRRVQSVCVLKPRKEQAETLRKFEKHGFEYASIKRCSLPEQEILRERDHILNDGEYMTLLFARKRSTIDD